MPNKKKSVLFFSTGDATRSQIAEGFFLAWAGPDVTGVSTAVRAKQISPYAAEVMREVGIDISGQKSRTVSETFRRQFTCVISLCEMPRERCPLWPFTRSLFKWDVIDPVKEAGPDQRESVRRARDEIGPKVKELLEKTLPELRPGAFE
jgi:arsenate reductase (thioredoxin)